MNILMISGSYPPEVCGVGDYTAQLVESLRRMDVEVRTLEGVKWNLGSLAKILEATGHHRYDIIHIQYPTVGYGSSLIPQLLSLKVPAIVTLHEFSQARLPRRLATIPFLLFARRLLFTSAYELAGIQRMLPGIGRKSEVIPIGTNVRPSPIPKPRRFDEVIYFGLIAPRKGIEQVIEFSAAASQTDPGIRVRVIGRVPDAFRDYARQVMALAADLPIRWTLDKSESEVADILAEASLAYLPFPDGASDRRGSLKAALSSGVVCISTDGKAVPDELRKHLVFASDGKDALEKARSLLTDRSSLESLSAESRAYSESFDWEKIARKHLEVYARFAEQEKPHSRWSGHIG